MSQARMSTAQLYNTSLNAMLDRQKAVNHTQEQISSNQRVLSPGDDPVAATRILQLNQELGQLEQYNNSLSTLENRLEREEVALGGVSDLVLKAQELVNEAGNGALNEQQRGDIAVELQSVVDNMAQEMNSRSATGEYLFAGYQGGEQPFVKGADGRYEYQGDEGQRTIRIGPTTQVAASDSGKHVFEDIPAAVESFNARANPGNSAEPPAVITDEQVVDREAFEQFYPEDAIIEFQPQSDVSPPGMNYSVRQVSDGRVLAENVPFNSGETIEIGGASVRINGRPAPGDSFTIESTEKKGLLEGLEDYIQQLNGFENTEEGKEALATARDHAIQNLDNAQTRLLETRSEVGSRLNVVEQSRSSNEDTELVMRESLSELADLDYAEAVSRLSHQSFVLEAAQQSFSRVSRLSLFNYL